MRIVPDSWGVARRTREFNNCNLPAGEGGGQFGQKDDPRCGAALQYQGNKAFVQGTFSELGAGVQELLAASFDGPVRRETMLYMRDGKRIPISTAEQEKIATVTGDAPNQTALAARGIALGMASSVPVFDAIAQADLTAHTHPSSSVFSSDDLFVLAKRAPAGARMAVVTANGSQYAVRIEKPQAFEAAFMRYLREEEGPLLDLVVAGILDDHPDARIIPRSSGQLASFRYSLTHDAARAAVANEVASGASNIIRQSFFQFLDREGIISYGQALTPTDHALQYRQRTRGFGPRVEAAAQQFWSAHRQQAGGLHVGVVDGFAYAYERVRAKDVGAVADQRR